MDEQPERIGITRDGKGKFTRTPQSARRDAAAADLKANGRTYQQIADELGYADRGEAWRGVKRALVDIVREPAERLIQTEAAELDTLYVEAIEILGRNHITVSNGRIITMADETGREIPLPDDGPKLVALNTAVKIRESYRKLYGLDAPSRVSVEAETLGREISRLLDAALGSDADDDDADA